MKGGELGQNSGLEKRELGGCDVGSLSTFKGGGGRGRWGGEKVNT